jgi:NADH:ubiquinone oxidoreductase subunit 2 (subunit N)
MFGGAYVVDDFSLVMKALFLISGYVVVLMSVDYIRDGDYYENEYYTLMLTSLLGMVMMSSSRDLISVFVALELLSIPAYMLAAWRHDYNTIRPHSKLGGKTPAEIADKHAWGHAPRHVCHPIKQSS